MIKKEDISNSLIKEVLVENFETEMKKISKNIDKYNYIALDTEFPGFIYQSLGTNNKENYYQTLKSNVDSLKLIQVGITICDKDGNYPKDMASWQFNFNFDLNYDKFSQESIQLLSNSGINFNKLSQFGVNMDQFGEALVSSGIVLNEDIKWISFHGAYDFAYLIKSLLNQPLPETEEGFFELMNLYFPNFYDIRYLVKNDNFRGSLSKLAQELDIYRIGSQHQAGSDSILTSEIFLKLKKFNQLEILDKGKNVLFGLGVGVETQNFSIINSLNSMSMNSTNDNQFPKNNNNYNNSNQFINDNYGNQNFNSLNISNSNNYGNKNSYNMGSNNVYNNFVNNSNNFNYSQNNIGNSRLNKEYIQKNSK